MYGADPWLQLSVWVSVGSETNGLHIQHIAHSAVLSFTLLQDIRHRSHTTMCLFQLSVLGPHHHCFARTHIPGGDADDDVWEPI